MNMTKQLLNTKDLKLAEAKELAGKLEITYETIEKMLKVQNPDWDNKTIKENEVILQTNKKAFAYMGLSIACMNLHFADRRGKNLIRDLKNAVEYAEEVGVNIY